MIINLVNSLNKILPLGKLINENLVTIKVLRENGNEAVNSLIHENMDFKEYLKFRFLNSIKDSAFIDNQIKRDNQKILDSMNDMTPALKDTVLEKLFQSDNHNTPSNSFCLETKREVQNFFKNIDYNKDMNVIIKNPFTGHDIKTLITHNRDTPNKRKDYDSHLNIDHAQLASGQINTIHKMTVDMRQVISDANVYYETIKGVSPQELSFDFTLYHELAHADYSQMARKNYNRNEKNSDISALIKIINTYDFDQKEAQKLCDNFLNYRINSADLSNYKSLDAEHVRVHYTEDAVLVLKQMIENDVNAIKQLPDREIPRYAEFIIDQIPSLALKVDKIDYFKKFEHDYKRDFAKNSDPDVISHDIDKIKYKVFKDDEIFNDLVINYLLKKDFNQGKEIIFDLFESNYLSQIVNNNYALYKEEKYTHYASIEKNFDSQLIKSKMKNS